MNPLQSGNTNVATCDLRWSQLKQVSQKHMGGKIWGTFIELFYKTNLPAILLYNSPLTWLLTTTLEHKAKLSLLRDAWSLLAYGHMPTDAFFCMHSALRKLVVFPPSAKVNIVCFPCRPRRPDMRKQRPPRADSGTVKELYFTQSHCFWIRAV